MTLLSLVWLRGPSGVYQAGKYVLRPVGGYTYAVDVNGHFQNVILPLDKAKNWCESHRQHIAATAPTGETEGRG